MSVALHLMYRDACNYKAFSDVVFGGALTDELRDRLLAARDDGAFIVAEQVGLDNPALSNDLFAARYPDEDDDHGYVELDDDAIEDGEGRLPTVDRQFEDFVVACEAAAAEGWDPDIAIEAAGGWQDPVKCAALRGGEEEK